MYGRTFGSVLESLAERFPNDVAHVEGDTRLTHTEVLGEVRAVGQTLHNPGTTDRIAALAVTGAATALLIGGDWINGGRSYALGLVGPTGEHDDAIDRATEITSAAVLLVSYSKRQLWVDNASDTDGCSAFVKHARGSDDDAESVSCPNREA